MLWRYANGNLVGSNTAAQGFKLMTGWYATQPNRLGSRWRNDRDVARGGTRWALVLAGDAF